MQRASEGSRVANDRFALAKVAIELGDLNRDDYGTYDNERRRARLSKGGLRSDVTKSHRRQCEQSEIKSIPEGQSLHELNNTRRNQKQHSHRRNQAA